MKQTLLILLGFLAFLLLPRDSLRLRAQTPDRDKVALVKLVSYEIVRLELKKPIRLLDSEGKEQRYESAYLVTVKGTFPRNLGMGFELFIGDYRVPEYGGTRDGLYFRIYDEKLLARLEGKEFRYRFGSPEIHGLDVRFSMRSAQPLKIQKEQ